VTSDPIKQVAYMTHVGPTASSSVNKQPTLAETASTFTEKSPVLPSGGQDNAVTTRCDAAKHEGKTT